jgi:hypothetical protein
LCPAAPYPREGSGKKSRMCRAVDLQAGNDRQHTVPGDAGVEGDRAIPLDPEAVTKDAVGCLRGIAVRRDEDGEQVPACLGHHSGGVDDRRDCCRPGLRRRGPDTRRR